MKLLKSVALFTALALLLTACGSSGVSSQQADAVSILLSDQQITVDGAVAGADETAAVYIANDIVYYESGKDFTYGEGSEKDAHTPEEAAAHTVVHITKPGAYSISGTLSQGQIAVDLGEDAKNDPEAVVTLILSGADITCQVAPAVIFYNVYECGSDDTESAAKDVDTSAAGANVIIADGTVNTICGSYVERIYKPESVVLNEDQTEVEDADKLHKYDGAFYSKRSMNISGGKKNSGVLNIKAENEGLDSEMHLTVNGGNIFIESGNDGINTNEDGVSVTTINGGTLTIHVTGETGEGDGIDSNGWLVINGGTVIAAACSDSADAGIDSDMGIHINGGTVIASGHMLDRIEDGGQTYAVFNFAQKQDGSQALALKNSRDKAVLEIVPENTYSVLVFSSPDLEAGDYTLWSSETQLAGGAGGMMGGPGMQQGMNGMQPPAGEQAFPENFSDFENMTLPEGFDELEDMTPPESFDELEDMTPPEGFDEFEDMTPPEGFDAQEGGQRPNMQGGNKPQMPGNSGMSTQEQTSVFTINEGGNMFSGILALEH